MRASALSHLNKRTQYADSSRMGVDNSHSDGYSLYESQLLCAFIGRRRPTVEKIVISGATDRE